MDAHIFIDDAEFERLKRIFGDTELFRKARVAALKRTAGNLRKNLGRLMRGASYLRGRELTGAIGRVAIHAGGIEASVKVAGPQKPAHLFKLNPSRITARKGARSVNWPSPAVQIGPGEADRKPERAGFSRPFIAKTKSGLKAMYMREKSTGNLVMPKIVSPQYFAAFEKVGEPILREARDTFQKRLEHEIDYRLGLGG